MIDLISNSMLMGFLTGIIFFSLPTAMLQVHLAGRRDAAGRNQQFRA